MEEEMRAMKTLKQILFALVAVAGLSLAVSAQKGDQPKPPKDPPPKIEPKPKDNPPKDQPKPKKPGMSFFVAIPKESEFGE